MSSKAQILERIRRNQPSSSAAPRPALTGAWIEYPDRLAQFTSVLTSVGGATKVVDDRGQLRSAVGDLPCLANARKVVCALADLDLGNCPLDSVEDPHSLADVDVAILPGQFAVAENGAVWVSSEGVRHRAIFFLCENLVLVVPRDEILHHLHEAYARLRFEGAQYGLFISGPSKTADIEQSLVIGAHGPRSLTVVFA